MIIIEPYDADTTGLPLQYPHSGQARCVIFIAPHCGHLVVDARLDL